MSIWEAIVFGFVQGISEYLPISSTAHIVITEMLLGYHFPGLAFEIFLHLASILAVILYFRKDLLAIIGGFFRYIGSRAPEHRAPFWFGTYLLVATAITGVLGLFLNDFISDSMKTPGFIAAALAVTGVMIILTERLKKYGNRKAEDMNLFDAIVIGLCQTFAVIPGISRSGSTLIPALWLGLEREAAVRFSFLLVVPVVLGSSVLALTELHHAMWGDIGAPAIIVAFIATFIFSLIGIKWLISFLNRSKLIYFALYCFVLAICAYFLIEPGTMIDIE